MSKSKTFGVGLRCGHVFGLNSDGLPMPNDSSAVLIGGTLIEGIKTLPVTDPAPRRISHFGDDRVLSQDSLPATESGSYQFTTSKTNQVLDAMLEGGKVRTINGNSYTGGNTDNKGSEPQVLALFYRQALDADKSSASYGKLRQWEGRAYGSSRITKTTPSFEAENTDTTYEGTPTPVKFTHWFEQFSETNWGFTEAEYINDTSDYQPRWNFGRGNGTLTAFSLTHAPVDNSSITVWVDGTATTPSSVNTSTANPAFTLGSAAANNGFIAVKIETSVPGDS
jgi:hypothetical protein